uniref:RdRp n=1 Tax=Atrato Sobemo-like virus 2 TaxID=2689348 RepID=A0A6B9KH09_9VIRU|nr:RdRp [Atrato Sobemo-like virus 2]
METYCLKAVEEPDQELKDRILYIMEKAYSTVIWTLPDNYDSYLAFERAVSNLDLTSSPGYPYCLEKPTIGQWLEHDGLHPSWRAMQRLWIDVQRVFNGTFDHIQKVFIKMEPHKVSKIVEQRWRLIIASALPVQVVWHMLFDYQNDKEIEQAYYIPSQQGLKLCGGHWKLYYQQWKQRGFDVGLDKSAWDWTAPGWALMLDLKFRLRMGRGSRMREWATTAAALYRDMFETSKLLMPEGYLLQQEFCGLMKSGCVNTISTNSHMQVMIHIAANQHGKVYPLPSCCGDDTLQCSTQCDDLEKYRRYGIFVKQVERGLEFVGHRFEHDGPKPAYYSKHLYKACYQEDDILPQYLDSMCRMYVKTPQFEVWENIASELGIKLFSREYYMYWYDVATD